MTNKKVTNTYMSDTELSSSSKSQPLRIAAPVVVAVALVAGFTPIFSSAPVSGSLSSSALLASATTFNVSTAAQLTSALSTAPAGTASSPTVISLAQGTYTGQFTVDQPYTELIGATGNAADVVITDNVTAAAGGSDKGSSTVINTASDTTFENLTIANTNTADAGANPPAGSQDVALYTSGDRQVYDNVSVLGYQDTLYLNTASSTGTDRSYFYNSYIQGAVDFIFGTGTAVFAYSTIDALDRVGGTVMAPNTYSGNARGYLFDHDRFISSTPTGGFNLGRAWPSSGQALGQATVENSTIDGGYSSTPWIDWTAGTAWQGTSRFYTANNSGPGAPSAANGNSTITDAAATPPVTQASWLAGTDGWNPLITPTAALPSAPTRLTSASTSQTSVTLTWSRGTDSTVVGYNIYRVSGGTPPTSLSGLSPLNSTPVTSNTYLNSGLSPNSTYSYVVVSVNAAGTPSALTATSSVTTSTPAPNITVSTTAELTSALAAVATNTAPYVIAIAPGTYTGPFTLAGNNVTLTSTVSTPSSVILTAASSAAGTATLTVSGTGDTVEGISVTQTGSDLGQGTPATHATGTQDTFDNDVITGGTRAVWADSSYFATQSQQLYENTTITGANDLVLGRASAVFDNVTFDVTSSSGVVLVPSTATTLPGFLVTYSTVVTPTGVSNVELGTPYIAYPNSYTPISVGKAFVENSVLGAGINVGTPWGAGYNSNTNSNTATFATGNYGEYSNTGAGAAITVAANRPQLTAATLPSTVIGTGWYSLPAPPAASAPAAPALTASSGPSSVSLSWSDSSASSVTGYDVYSVTSSTAKALVGTTNSTQFNVSGLTAGTSYTFEVIALVGAVASSPSNTVSATPTAGVAPNITVSTAAGLTAALAGAAGTTSAPYVIAIAPGTYTGPFALAGNNVTLTSTVSTSSSVILNSTTLNSQTLSVSGTGDTVEGITMTQTAASGNNTAAYTTGTQDTFSNDVISGATRAVWADSSYFATQSQQLYENTTITGANDLALGRASAVFDNVTFDVTSSSGVVLVPSTATSFPGFLITDSTIAPATSVTNVDLGVPYIAYPNTYTPNSVGKAFVENSVLNAGINTTSPWGAGYNSNTSTNSALFTTGNYGEFDNTGAGAATAASANRPQLTAATLPSTVIGTGWYSLPAPPAVLAPGISGVVTDAQTGAPLAGICAYLYSSAGVRTSDPGTCTTANGSYTMPVATPGTYSLYFSDPAGIFTTASIAATVGSQGLTAINERLMPVVPQGVSGRVTDAQTGAPIAGVCVYLYTIAGVRTADTGFCTDTNGYYTESVATPGTYDVAFFDPSGLHITQWSGGAALQTGATAVTIAANTDTVGVNAPMAPAVTMGIMGSVTNAATGAPLPGVCVYLYTLAGTRTSDQGTCTSPNNGNYLMNVASPGTYKVAFTDPSGGPLASNGNYYATQWFGGAATEAAATTVTVTSGKATENISVAMAGA